jgi:hypothetical protein
MSGPNGAFLNATLPGSLHTQHALAVLRGLQREPRQPENNILESAHIQHSIATRPCGTSFEHNLPRCEGPVSGNGTVDAHQ